MSEQPRFFDCELSILLLKTIFLQMAALPVKQARKRREQLNGFQVWLASYVIYFFQSYWLKAEVRNIF